MKTKQRNVHRDRKLYEQLHGSFGYYGRTGLRLKPYIKPLIGSNKSTTILDYGCGKGALGKSLLSEGYTVRLYDPFVPEFSTLPKNKYGIVLCTDVLEHIPEQELDAVLLDIKRYSENVIFVISLTFADHILANGNNAHCTIKPKSWWLNRIAKIFNLAEEVQTRQETALSIITWKPEIGALKHINRTHLITRLKRCADKLVGYYANHFNYLSQTASQLKELNASLDGKSVAIVGNSKALSENTFGADIDNHDVVIRINRAPIISFESHGKKTTWITTSVPISRGLVDSRGVKTIIWGTSKVYGAPLWFLSRKRKVVYLERPSFLASFFGWFLSEKKPRLSTGFKIVNFVAASNANTIDLYGFDGFSSNSLSGNHSKLSAPHNFDEEFGVIQQLKNKDKRICIH